MNVQDRIDKLEHYIADLNRRLTALRGAGTVQEGCFAYLNAAQDNIVDSTDTLVNLDTEDFDAATDFNTTTHLYTVNTAGRYILIGQVGWKPQVADKRHYVQIKETGGPTTLLHRASYNNTATGWFHVNVSGILALSSGDTIGLYARQEEGVNTPDLWNGKTNTFMAIWLVG